MFETFSRPRRGLWFGRLVLASALAVFAAPGRGGGAPNHPLTGRLDGASDPPGAAADARTDEEPVSAEAERLLRVVEDPRMRLNERGQAAVAVGKLKEAGAIPRLARLLPRDYTVLGYDIVIALGDLGDSRALPALLRYRETADRDGDDIPGKINAALDGALEKLKGRPEANRRR